MGEEFDFGFGPMRLIEAEFFGDKGTYTFKGVWGTLIVGDEAFKDFLSKREQAAQERAEQLYSEGYHCVSGKHLKVAKSAHRLLPGYGGESGPVGLRKRLAEKPEQVVVQTVDVDTYVALKWLRRRRAGGPIRVNINTDSRLYDYQQDFLRQFAGLAAVPRPLPRTEFFSGGPCGKTQTGRIYGRGLADAMLSKGEFSTRPARSAAEAEARYIAELEALPDSLYKRTQLRLVRLPKAVRKDHAARKKAFEREEKKYVREFNQKARGEKK